MNKIVIVSDTIAEGRTFAVNHFNTLKNIRVLSTYNSIVGHAFHEDTTVFVLTEDKKLWNALEPALRGALVFLQVDYYE